MPGDSLLLTSLLLVLASPDRLLKLIKRLPSVLVPAFRLYFRSVLITVMLTGNYWFNLHAGYCSAAPVTTHRHLISLRYQT